MCKVGSSGASTRYWPATRCAWSDSIIRPAQAAAASVLDSGVVRSSMVQGTGLEDGMPSGSI